MKRNVTKAVMTVAACMCGAYAFAQKPSEYNLPDRQYPQINADRTVTFQVDAPQAQSVAVDLGGRHAMTKNGDGL